MPTGFSVGWSARPCMLRILMTDRIRRGPPSSDRYVAEPFSPMCVGRALRRMTCLTASFVTGVSRYCSLHGPRYQWVAFSWTRLKRSFWKPEPLCFSHTMSCESFRSEEHTSELQSRENVVCRLLLEKKNWNL